MLIRQEEADHAKNTNKDEEKWQPGEQPHQAEEANNEEDAPPGKPPDPKVEPESKIRKVKISDQVIERKLPDYLTLTPIEKRETI